MKLPVRYFDNFAGEPLAAATAGAAGIDLPAGNDCEESWRIPGFGACLVSTGVSVAIPEGHFGRIVLRSGHGVKRNLSCHVGTIDRDYRGEIMVLVRNHSGTPQEIQPGERFAQLIVIPCAQVEIEPVEELGATARGAGGFGSTGS